MPAESSARRTAESLTFAGEGGIRLAADAFGPVEGEPILFLHGGGQTRHAWGSTARLLGEQGWRAIALDARGHGSSEWAPDGDYRIDAFAADLRHVVASLGRKPAVVGASLGGITSLVVEGEAARSVLRALVLVDIAPRTEPEGVQKIIDFMSADPDGFATLEDAADAVARYLPHRPRPTSFEGLKKNLRRRDDGRWQWHWDPELMHGRDRVAKSRDPERLSRAARRLVIPAMLVRGRMSDVVSEESVRHFLEDVPHAKFVDVSGAGHMVAGDENDAFTEAVTGFLATLS